MKIKKHKSKALFILLVILLLGNWGGCKREDVTASLPALISLAPALTAAGTVNLLLTVTGSNFSTDSEIFFNGSAMTTNYIKDTEIRCLLSAADTKLNSTAGQVTVSVFVRDSQTGDSNTLDFTVLKGCIFRNPVKISASESADNPDLAINSIDDIFVRWNSLFGSSFRISQNNGNSWNEIFFYDQVNGGSKMISDHNDNLNIVWFNQQNEMFFSRSTDQGNSWRTPVKIAESTGDFYMLDIAVGHSGVIVVTCIKLGKNDDESDDEIYMSHSADFGKSWHNLEKFSDGRIHHVHYGKDRNFYLVWDYLKDNTTGWRICFSKSFDNGTTWSDKTKLEDGHDPNMVSHNNGSLYLLHQGGSTGLTFLRSQDQGETWVKGLEIPVNPEYGIAHHPEISIDVDAGLHIAWMGKSDIIDSSRDANIYYSRSINQGANWTDPINISNQTGCFYYPGPKVAADAAGNVYLIWINGEDELEGSVYFARNKR